MSSPGWKTHIQGGPPPGAVTFCEAVAGAFPCIVNVWPAVAAPETCNPNVKGDGDCGSASSGPTADSKAQTYSQATCSSLSTLCAQQNEEGTDISSARAGSLESTAGTCAPGSVLDPLCETVSIDVPESKGPMPIFRKQTSGLSAALKALPFPNLENGARLSVRLLNCGGITSAETKLGGDSFSSATRAAPSLAPGAPVHGHAPNLAARDGSRHACVNDASIRRKPGLMPLPDVAHETEDGSNAGSLSEAWDSLPCFSPSLVDRLWAGRASVGSMSPRSRPHRFHLQQPQQPLAPQQQPHEATSRKRSQSGLLLQRKDVVSLPTGLASEASDVTAAAAASVAASKSSEEPGHVAGTCARDQVPAAPAPAAAPPAVLEAATAAACGGLLTGGPLLRRAATGSPAYHPATEPAPQLPCMALVAAAAAATAAPRALGAVCVAAGGAGGGGGGGCGEEFESSRGLVSRQHSTQPPHASIQAASGGAGGGGGATSLPSALPGSGSSAERLSEGGEGCEERAAGAGDGAGDAISGATAAKEPNPSEAAATAAPAAAVAAILGCDLPRVRVSCCSAAEPGGPGKAVAAAVIVYQQQQQQPARGHTDFGALRGHDAAAVLAVMASTAFDEPRGHVHNGPRMPLGTNSPQYSQTHNHGQSDLGAVAATAAAGAGDGVARRTAAPCSHDPWARQGGGGHSPSDSPLSQASTVWEHPQAPGPYAVRELHRPKWLGGCPSHVSQCSLATAGGSDLRTQWWDLTGRFDEVDNSSLRHHLFPFELRTGSGRRRGAGTWWQWWTTAR